MTAAPVVVDARGMRCPWPALRLARAMRENDHAILIADDPQAEGEVAALAEQQQWKVAAQVGARGEGRWLVSRN